MLRLNLGLGLNGNVKPAWLSGGISGETANLVMDFANERYAVNQLQTSLDNTWDFSRASEQEYINRSQLMTTAANNEPAINHLAGNEGFAHFEGRTNILFYSNMVGAGSTPDNWIGEFGGGGSPVASDYGDGDGAQAYEFSATASRSFIQVATGSNLSANTTYVASVFVEDNPDNLPLNQIMIITNQPAGATFEYPYANDGAYVPSSGERVYCNIVNGSTAGSVRIRLGAGCSSNSTGTVKVSRPQIEGNVFPSSYKPTNGSNNTTAINEANISGAKYTAANISSTEGTFFIEVSEGGVDGSNDYVFTHENTSGHYTQVILKEVSGNKTVLLDVVKNGGFQAKMSQTFDDFPLRIAYTYAEGDIRLAVNDRPIVTDSGRSMEVMPAADKLVIGDRNYSTSSPLNGYVPTVEYYPETVTDDQLYNRAVNNIITYTLGGDSYAANSGGKGLAASLETDGITFNNLADGGDTLAEQETIVLADEYAGFRPLIFMDGSVNGHGTVSEDIARYQNIFDGYNGKVVFLSPIVYPNYYNTADGQHVLDLTAAMLLEGWDVVDSTAIARELSGVSFTDATDANDVGYNDAAYDALFQVDNVHPETALSDALADAAVALS